MALSLLWILPSVLAAKYLIPQHKGDAKMMLENSRTIPEAIPFSDPFNPSLDDQRGIPMERQPEKYRGRIVYARPVQHPGTTNYAATFSDVPFSSRSRDLRKMINNKNMYEASAYTMVLPWDMPAPVIRNRPRFYDNLYDHDSKKPPFFANTEEVATLPLQPAVKKIRKSYRK